MKIKYTITGLDCPNCAAKLADKMAAIPDIDSAKINFLTEKLTVETSLSESDFGNVYLSILIIYFFRHFSRGYRDYVGFF